MIADQLSSHDVKLQHGVFYFKLDQDDELVFLFATNLKTEQNNNLCLLGTKELKLSIPEKQERKLMAILTGEPFEEEKEKETFRMGLKFRCPFCEKPLSKDCHLLVTLIRHARRSL